MMRRVTELSLRWIIDGLKYLFQRDAGRNGGELQHPEHLEQQQEIQAQTQAQVQVQLPTVTSTAKSVTATSPDMLLSTATMDTASASNSHSAIFQSSSTASDTFPEYSLTTITDSLREETMEGNTTNTALAMTKHHEYMRHALEMAEIALRTDEVPVGCVFVHKGEIIGRGMNDTNRSLCGTRHAEFVALEHILKTNPPSIFQETDLYVTVEPCIMCASALRQLKIRAVYFGCLNDRFGGCGGVFHIDSDPSIDPPYPCFGGVYREEAIMLLRRFYIQENERAPAPIAKKNRELKTEIASIEVMEGRATILKPEIAAKLEAMEGRVDITIPKRGLSSPRVDKPLNIITA